MSVWLEPVIEAYRKFYGDVGERWIVDVGSRDGDDAAWLASHFRPGNVTCVEARPDAAAAIKAKYPDFEVLAFAASDRFAPRAPFLAFDEPEFSGSSSLRLSRSRHHASPSHLIGVTRVRLDETLRPGIIDILKVDTEGHSMEVLSGLEGRMSDVLVAHVETETLERAAWGEPANNHAVAYFMRANGFRLFDVSYQWGPSIEDQVWVSGDFDFPEPEILR